ncbi:hypothetical protein BKA70DRAFT_1424717 [Coprinopsis sp. MPI-PUGE-AT-0042]|nr:hypothetical protein BKA70DRAFT_1424717 [Coprinopsis sp. MPI-PUGE-AT-0042]
MPAPLAPQSPQGLPHHYQQYPQQFQQPTPPPEIVPPQYDASQLSTELSHIKHLHAQDIHYFQNEISHLRRLLFSSDRALQDSQEAYKKQSLQLDRVARRRDIIIEERDALQSIREGLNVELDGKKEEVRGLVRILAEVEKELQGVAEDGRPARWSTAGSINRRSINRLSIISMKQLPDDASSTSASIPLCPPSVPTPVERYTPLPARIHTMVQTLESSDAKFASAYEAWSDSIKHQRRQAQAASQGLATQLQQKEERIRELEIEGRRLAAENSSLRGKLGVAEREVGASRRELTEVVRELREVKMKQQKHGHLEGGDQVERVDVGEVVEHVQELNSRICDTAMRLASIVEPRPSSSVPVSTIPTTALSGDDALSVLFQSLPPEDLEPNIQALLQATLASWCARVIQSWDLDLDQPGSGELLAAVYRRMKTVDPSMTAQWRALTRAQLRFSSSQWTKSLVRTLQVTLDRTGVRYTKSDAYVERVVEGLVGAAKGVRRVIDGVVVNGSERHREGEPIDVEVFLPTPGSQFDHTLMNDAGGYDNVAEQQEMVLATVQLGLTQARGPSEEKEVIYYPCVVTRWTKSGDLDSRSVDEEVPPPPIAKS